MGAEPVHLLPVCRADHEDVLPVLQQRPFLTQLLDQQGDVGRGQRWCGDSGDSGDNPRRFWPGAWRQGGDRVATEAATRCDSGGA